MDDDYDMLPHREIVALKKDIEALKKGPGSQDIHQSMDELLHSMHTFQNTKKAFRNS